MSTGSTKEFAANVAFWCFLFSVIGIFLYLAGIGRTFLQCAYVCVVAAIYLVFGWLMYGFRMLHSGQFAWPVAVSLTLVVIALGLSRTQSTTPAATSDDSDAELERRVGLTLALIAAFLAGMDLAQNITVAGTTTMFEAHVRDARRVALRPSHNLKRIGLGLHNYHELKNVFPPGAIAANLEGDQTGLKTHHGWATFLLPHMDQLPLYKRIDFSAAWDAPKNEDVMSTYLHYFQNDAVNSDDKSIHYAGNDRLFGVNNRIRFRDIKDGASNTMFVGEVPSNWRAWGRPGNWRDVRLGINRSVNGFGSPNKNGALFVRVDGSVKFLSDKVDQTVLEKFADPQDGNSLPPDF